ncbi:MAG: 3'(2'),5'-bisphosphate nucleotidase CysQ [Thermomicrobiales bacterium]|nr:3'(2'),5'-bisphosphate nucleotidase CysQ [Thermomicrobiales bacterium]MCO5220042.1 3'(2'),5'-bisphosphate nucleotidase CysQ [Thermomicrobiales bacterium]
MRDSSIIYAQELDVAKHAARTAGAAVLDFYTAQSAESYVKQDGSVVTDADLAADRIIRETILDAFPNDALLTEEGADDEARLSNSRVWIIDPIDGTNQFVSRTGEFDMLIALVIDGRPVVSVMYQPTEDLLLSATTGHGAGIERKGTKEALRLIPLPQDQPPRLMTSVWLGYPENFSFFERMAVRLGAPAPQVSQVGISVRRIMPGSQAADSVVGYKLGSTIDDQTFAWEWDFAAPDLIIHEAGGSMTDLRGNLHHYNKRIPRNERGVIFSVDPITTRRVVDAIEEELGAEI